MSDTSTKHARRALLTPVAAAIVTLSLVPDGAMAHSFWQFDGWNKFKWGFMSGLKWGKTRVLSNPAPIVINDTCADPELPECAALLDVYEAEDAPAVPVAKASPYVSSIEVPSTAFPNGAKITDVNVYINDIHHDYLNDVDILLMAPDGRWVMLTSNVSAAGATPEGGVLGVKAEGLNWKFDDSAKLPLPRSVRDDGRLSGRETNPLYNVIYDEWVGVWTDTALRTFKPSDYDGSPDSDHFPDNAVPSTTSFNTPTNSVSLTTATVLGPVTAENPESYKKVINGPTLSSLNGISPVGEWCLVVVDDFYWYAGEIKGGWSLEITAQR